MTFSIGQKAPFSVPLYAEAFGLTAAEASDDISALLSSGGALPFSLFGEGRVLSQGIAIPFSADGAPPILYLYALATDLPSRGQGLLRTLIGELSFWARREAYAALCLLPADGGLACAYRRMGFTEEYLAGGGADLAAGDALSLCFDSPMGFVPCPPDELRIPLGAALPPQVFSYAVSSLGDTVIPCRIGEEYAILDRRDPRFALAVTGGLLASVRRRGEHRYLLMPLGGPLPSGIPEPLPR